MEEYEFEIGETVRVVNPNNAPRELVENIGFNDDMTEMIGKEYVISDMQPSAVLEGVTIYSLVEGGGWVFAGQWLEPVNKREQNIHEDDFEGFF